MNKVTKVLGAVLTLAGFTGLQMMVPPLLTLAIIGLIIGITLLFVGDKDD